MEALKKFDIEELLRRQKMLDEKFDEKETVRKRNLKRIEIAYYTELGELFQELKGEWNYWKNTTKTFDKNKVLEELSDCLHFVLSEINEIGYDEMHTLNIEDLEYSIKIRVHQYNKFQNRGIEDLLVNLISSFLSGYYKQVFIFMGALVIILGSSIEEFLEVHHRVWERNMGERTRVDY